MRKYGLQPVVDDMTEIVVMGTFPSEHSLRTQQYYAKPSNDFWQLIGSALDENIEELSYTQRLAVLSFHRIGLWDIFHSCVRTGSLDRSIKDGKLNDFGVLNTVFASQARLSQRKGSGKVRSPVSRSGIRDMCSAFIQCREPEELSRTPPSLEINW